VLVSVRKGDDKPLNGITIRDVPLRDRNRIIVFALLLAGALQVQAKPPQAVDSANLTYADVADAVSTSPIVAIAVIAKAKRLKGDLAGNVPAGQARFLVTARVSSLLVGKSGLPERIDYLLDAQLDENGRPPKLTKRKVVLAGAPVAGKPASIQLTSARGQMDWQAPLEARVRAIVTEAVAPDAPPRILGIGNAFHVRGSLPGESETQLFLKTVGDQPVSLNVLRRPGEEPQWAVALGDIIDDSAKPPAPETLLWYRLACFLPATLPEHSVAALAVEDAAAASADYRYVLNALGTCQRTPVN